MIGFKCSNVRVHGQHLPDIRDTLLLDLRLNWRLMDVMVNIDTQQFSLSQLNDRVCLLRTRENIDHERTILQLHHTRKVLVPKITHELVEANQVDFVSEGRGKYYKSGKRRRRVLHRIFNRRLVNSLEHVRQYHLGKSSLKSVYVLMILPSTSTE